MNENPPPGAAPFVAVLQRFHADETPHSGRTLIAHLLGTYRLLESWGNPPAICRAGLFHSIYGTNIFEFKSASFDERPTIRDAIGDEAERLAFLFCVSERPVAFLKAAIERNYGIDDRVHGGRIAVTPIEIRALMEIEVANFLEQPGDADDVRLLHDTLLVAERGGPLVSGPARDALAAHAKASAR